MMTKVAQKVAENMDPGEEKDAFVHLLDEHTTLVKMPFSHPKITGHPSLHTTVS